MIKHATAGAFVFCDFTGGWRLGSSNTAGWGKAASERIKRWPCARHHSSASRAGAPGGSYSPVGDGRVTGETT